MIFFNRIQVLFWPFWLLGWSSKWVTEYVQYNINWNDIYTFLCWSQYVNTFYWKKYRQLWIKKILMYFKFTDLFVIPCDSGLVMASCNLVYIWSWYETFGEEAYFNLKKEFPRKLVEQPWFKPKISITAFQNLFCTLWHYLFRYRFCYNRKPNQTKRKKITNYLAS